MSDQTARRPADAPAVEALGWDETDRLTALLAPHAPADPGARRTFLAGARALLVRGKARALVAEGPDGTPGGLFAQGGDGCWTLELPLGTWSDAAVAAAFRHLARDARLIAWDDGPGHGWTAALAPLGARPFERRSFVQDLARVAHPATAAGLGGGHDGAGEGGNEVGSEGAGAGLGAIRLAPWTPTDAGFLTARADALAYSLEALFLTAPASPTAAACRAAYAGAARLDVASFVAWADDRPVGAVLAAPGEQAGEGLLFDLWVEPAARGRGVGRRLVAAMQAAMRAAGLRTHRFLTLGSNDPVMRLFRPEELLATAITRGGYWDGTP